MPVRWVSFARVSMQRPGHLVAVAGAASDASPTNLKGLSREYVDIVRRRCVVDDTRSDDVARYLKSLRLWKRYGGRQGELAKLVSAKELPPVELQDIWLADPVLPSATGAVTDEVVDELPQLAISVGLARSHNFTRSERGRSVAALYRDELAKAAEGDQTVNLFRLVTAHPPRDGDRAGASCYLLYCLIEADGDFLAAAWATELETGNGNLTRASFGNQLPVACRRLADRLVSASTLADRHLIGRLDTLARHIEEKTPATEKTWGGGRPRDQVATLRLEPYVDFGLLTRRSRTDYDYMLSDPQREFFTSLAETADPVSFLDEQLVASYLSAIGINPSPIEETEIWERVEDAYRLVRSGLGYAPAKEVVLLAIAILLNEGGRAFFEVVDGLRVVRAEQKRRPDHVRYGVSSTGKPTYIRIGKGAKA
jgi:hypothetical protein